MYNRTYKEQLQSGKTSVLSVSGKLIYESPDGGRTVYAREFGSNDRGIVHGLTDEESVASALRNTLYEEINSIVYLSLSNPAFKDMLDKLLTMYYLVRDETHD